MMGKDSFPKISEQKKDIKKRYQKLLKLELRTPKNKNNPSASKMRGLYCLISFSVLLRSSNAFTSFSGLSTTSFTQTKNDESSSRVVFYRKSDDYLENLDKMQMSEEGRRAAERGEIEK